MSKKGWSEGSVRANKLSVLFGAQHVQLRLRNHQVVFARIVRHDPRALTVSVRPWGCVGRLQVIRVADIRLANVVEGMLWDQQQEITNRQRRGLPVKAILATDRRAGKD